MTRILIKRSLTTAGVAAVLALGLAACGGSSHNNTQVAVTPTPPPAAQKLEDTFGTIFGVDYRASVDSEPTHPNPGDIIPLDLTKEPTALHT